jgi:hypothetical protein
VGAGIADRAHQLPHRAADDDHEQHDEAEPEREQGAEHERTQPTPTPIAAGRLRPGPRRRRCGLIDSVATRAAASRCPCLALPYPVWRSDLEQLGFLVLDHLVDGRHVLLGGLVELLLRPPDLVLAGLAVRAILSSASLACRRMLRMETLASSPLCRATLPSSRRRSSVSCGNTTRMIMPSFVGLTPRSLSRIAFSIAPSWLGSYGLITAIRASATVIEAICGIGVGVP